MTVGQLKAAIANEPDDLPVQMVMVFADGLRYMKSADMAAPVRHMGIGGPKIAVCVYSRMDMEDVPITASLHIH